MATEILSPAQCLRDRDFQRWMVSIKAMVIRTVTDTDLELFSSRPSNGPSKKRPLLSYLSAEERVGTIVHMEDVAEFVRGSIDRLGLQAGLNCAHELQGDMVHPDVLFHKKHVGWGIGVEEFPLNNQTIVLAHYLYQRFSEEVSIGELAMAGYGVDDKSTRSQARKGMSLLRMHHLKDAEVLFEYNGLTLQSAIDGSTIYRMIPKRVVFRPVSWEPEDINTFIAEELNRSLGSFGKRSRLVG